MDQARTAPLTPKPIMELATAFQRSRPLLTAFELGLFTTLNAEARTSEETADALGTDPRATDRLMNALVALGLLEKRDGRFSNTPLGRAATWSRGGRSTWPASATRITCGTRGAG